MVHVLRIRRFVLGCALLGLACAATPAWAVNCVSPFVDVASDSSYCIAAQWLKQRGITMGCSDANHFCPNDAVTRAAMALLLNRMGNVLAPKMLHQAEAFEGDASLVACQTAPYAINGYTRMATGVASTYFDPDADGEARTRLVYSTDDGATWNSWASFYIPASVSASLGATASSTAPAAFFLPGQDLIFGVQITPVAGVHVSGGCEMTVRVENWNTVVID